MVKIKKDGIKNMYCSTCEKWMTEFYVSRHLHSKSHFIKKHFQKNRLQKKRKSNKLQKKLSIKSEHSTDCQTPETTKEFIFEGDTLKKCRHGLHNSVLEGCSDAQSSPHCSQDVQEKTKRHLFDSNREGENEEAEYIPQNILGVLELDDWDFDALLAGNENQNSYGKSTEQPQEMCSIPVQNIQSDHHGIQVEFPIQVVGGACQQSVCTVDHANQMSYYKCHVCNPATYKDYESW